MQKHVKIWNQFCERHNVSNTWVQLFETLPDGTVLTKQIGSSNVRYVLKRSNAMEALVRCECAKLISDWKNNTQIYDGLIYFMAKEDKGRVVPLYIGKAETVGKKDGNLSANIKGIEGDTSKFARWGDNYAYHIGDLSAVVVPGHDTKHITNKYELWATALFKNYPSDKPKLKQPVYFWAKAWSCKEIGVWEEFGPTKLTFLEYLLIGVSSAAFGKILLNREGHNRNIKGEPE
jgi:hypothetical protein